MQKVFDMKLIGGILLIVGTSMGGALLVLPVTNSPSGFIYSSITMLFVCLLTIFTSLLVLEINLWLPSGSNIISMADKTLGGFAKLIAWVLYLLLLYSLLSAYISGGTDVIAGLTKRMGFVLPAWINSFVFTSLFGTIVYGGIKIIDHINRTLMFLKLGAYLLLVTAIMPHIRLDFLVIGQAKYVIGALMYIITSFGFAVIIPSLRTYFDGNVRQLRLVIIIGSFIPLLCYLLWNVAIMGIISPKGDNGLLMMLQQHYTPIELVDSISVTLNSTGITNLAQFFISISILTAFFGVSLSLVDFLADGMSLPKKGKKGIIVFAVAFLPPLIIVLLDPDAFTTALRYAGVNIVFLLMLIPFLMAWSGRYWKKFPSKYTAPGGKTMLIVATVISLALLVIAIKESILPSI